MEQMKSRRRCSTCKYCAPVFKGRDCMFCNNEKSRSYGRFINPMKLCCENHIPKLKRCQEQP